MQIIFKLITIIVIQTTLLFGTFYIIQLQESTMTEIGYQINEAGRIRALTYANLFEVNQVIHQNKNFDSSYLDRIDTIVNVLESGGSINGKYISNVSIENKQNVSELRKDYDDFNQELKFTIKNISIENNEKLISLGNKLISSADQLTFDLASYNMMLSQELISTAFYLIIINSILHIGLGYLIYKIFRKENKIGMESEKLKILGEFSARMAHDLRNPLSKIKLTVDILSKTNEKNNKITKSDYYYQIQEKLDLVNESINNMTRQINDVLNFSKTNGLEKSNQSLLYIIKRSITSLEIPNQIKIILPANDCQIFCDKHKIEIVFTNLIQNAIDAISNSGEIIIRISDENNLVRVEIQDSGPGFPENYERKLFTPLFTTKKYGTGLGLLTCKNIIEQHGGKIDYRTNPTTLIIILTKADTSK